MIFVSKPDRNRPLLSMRTSEEDLAFKARQNRRGNFRCQVDSGGIQVVRESGCALAPPVLSGTVVHGTLIPPPAVAAGNSKPIRPGAASSIRDECMHGKQPRCRNLLPPRKLCIYLSIHPSLSPINEHDSLSAPFNSMSPSAAALTTEPPITHSQNDTTTASATA